MKIILIFFQLFFFFFILFQVLSNNATYILAIVGISAAVTGGFSVGVDAFWDFNNSGKQFKDVDWTKFAEEDDDDDDDDDDDE